MSLEQTLLTVLQACNCKYLICVEFLWKRNWCVLLTRILRLIFLVGKKMNSDAVDTRFGDLVTQRNCSFAAAKLPCWSGSNHVANSVLNTLRWGIIEPVPEAPCLHIYFNFNMPRYYIPGSGVIRRVMIGACFPPRLFFSIFFHFRFQIEIKSYTEVQNTAQQRKVQRCSFLLEATQHPAISGPTSPPSCLLFYLPSYG